jgi:hypothetical protein
MAFRRTKLHFVVHSKNLCASVRVNFTRRHVFENKIMRWFSTHMCDSFFKQPQLCACILCLCLYCNLVFQHATCENHTHECENHTHERKSHSCMWLSHVACDIAVSQQDGFIFDFFMNFKELGFLKVWFWFQ